MRLTRAAAAAAQIHVDEPTDPAQVHEKATPQKEDRAPLGELTPNSVKSESPAVTAANSETFKISVQDTVQSQHTKPEPSLLEEDKKEDAALPLAVQEDLERASAHSQARMIRHTPQRSLLQGTELDGSENKEQDSTVNHTHGSAPNIEQIIDSSMVADSNEVGSDDNIMKEPMDMETPDLEVENPLIVAKNTPAKQFLNKEKFGMRSTSNKENMLPYSPMLASATASLQTTLPSHRTNDPQSASPLVPTTLATSNRVQREDPIEAMDALEEAIEQVDRSIPQIQHIKSPDRLQRPSPARSTVAKSPLVAKTATNQESARKSNAARIGSMHKSTPARAEPNTKTAAQRTTSINKPLAARSSSIGTSSAHPTPAPSKKPAEIPHSKPRPMSLSFPTPRPAPKSSKPATKSTFQLPGDAVAAKLKAAKDERAKRDDDDDATKRRAFTARPAPKYKEPANAAVVRHTAASRARESLMLGRESIAADGRINAVRTNGTPRKRTGSVRDSAVRSGPSAAQQAAAKRLSTLPKTGAMVGKTTTMPPPAASKPRPLVASTRVPPPGLVSTFAPRTSSATTTSRLSASVSGPAAGTKSTSKGKEVFRRAAVEKEAADKARRDKEEAARQARAAAAERGRIASREWAEKRQKMKAKEAKMGTEARASRVGIEAGAETKTIA